MFCFTTWSVKVQFLEFDWLTNRKAEKTLGFEKTAIPQRIVSFLKKQKNNFGSHVFGFYIFLVWDTGPEPCTTAKRFIENSF